MSRFRRMLTLRSTSNKGMETYKILFKAIVTDDSVIYDPNASNKKGIGIGFKISINDWTSTITTTASAKSMYPLYMYTVIKNIEGEVIVDNINQNLYFDEGDDAIRLHSFAVPKGEYYVSVTLKSEKIKFEGSGSVSGTTDRVIFYNYEKTWNTSSDGKGSATDTANCYCFDKLIYIEPFVGYKLDFKMTKKAED